jgi:hypothetical protein
MKNNNEITLTLNKKELEIIETSIREKIYYLKINASLADGKFKESAINSLYNIESIQNKIKNSLLTNKKT